MTTTVASPEQWAVDAALAIWSFCGGPEAFVIVFGIPVLLMVGAIHRRCIARRLRRDIRPIARQP